MCYFQIQAPTSVSDYHAISNAFLNMDDINDSHRYIEYDDRNWHNQENVYDYLDQLEFVLKLFTDN